MGALLRSGTTGAFRALGDTGRPVYNAALQLRESIRRRHAGLAEHFAVPQSNEQGDRIDWYAEFDGDVIAWTSATEAERAPARARLEEVRAQLSALSAGLLRDGNGAASQGDRQVFAKLLARSMHFPDEQFVYLVDGKPVITFWGFEHPNAPLERNPLLCLYPAPNSPRETGAPTPTATSAPALTAPVSPAVSAARPWWRWLLLALALALLLGLLLFGLRACAPSLGLNVPGLTLTAPSGTTAATKPMAAGDPSLPLLAPGGSRGLIPVQGGAVASTADPALVPPGVAATTASGAASATPLPDTTALPTPDMAAAAQTALAQAGATAPPPATAAIPMPNPAEPPSAGQTATPAGPPLTLPPDLANSTTDFLNGHWKAGAGIQDSRTGQPLRLEYQFENGQGNVTVRRSDGVSCSAPVKAAIDGGALALSSGEQALCGDGTRYDMPQVRCQPGARGLADCAGSYGPDQFPLSMRQAHP